MDILNEKTIGFAVTGSFCTLSQIMPQVERLVQAGAKVIPVLSEVVSNTDTRFGTAEEWREQLKTITGKKPLVGVKETEPFGPKGLLDLLIVAPCTGNTLGKLANGITDTGVTMAVKAHLRNERPVVLAVSTNDGLGAAAKNIGALLNMKQV
jgi:dipicolinate synthase subunit B